MRILVADDDFTSRTLVADVLREEGYDVITVTDGAQANAALRTADAPQIAIIDWLMPRMDGIEVVRQTRARPTDNPPYLIMLTSKARRDDMLAGFAAGANDYLPKPFDLGELLARVAAGRRMVEMQTALNDRLAAQHFQSQFHQITAQISAKLTSVFDQAGFDQAINAALQQLGSLFDADRSYLFRFTADLTRITATHEWHAPGIPPREPIQDRDITHMTWGRKQILAKKPLYIPDASSFPPEARAERDIFLAEGVRSLLCLPTIGAEGQLTGFIGFDMVSHTYEWSPEQIAMLQPIADAIGATIERLQTKEALVASEIRYHKLFETARDAILITDDNQRYVEVNQAACDLLGYSRAELEALAVPDVVMDVAETHKIWQTFIADGGQEGEVTLRGKDGRLVPTEYRAVANFTPSRHFSVMRDLTERKRHEAALREAQRQYEALFTQTHDAVFILDLDCRLLQCNEQAAELLGYELAEMYNLSAIDVSTDPESSHRVHQRLLKGEHVPIYERQYRRKEGQIITVEVSAEMVRDAAGEPIHIQNIVRDISERKKMEHALRDSESRLRSYIEHAPYGLFIADEHGRYVEVNPAACAVTGYDEVELLAMDVGDLLVPTEYAAAIKHFEQVKRTGSAVGEFTFQHKSGDLCFLQVNAVKLLSPTRIMAFTQDITERQQAEENLRQSHAELAATLQTLQEAQAQLVQQERLAAVGQLAAGIAHDFNNILAVILLYAQMMTLSRKLPPWEAEAMAIIEKQTQTASRLVQQILDFSRRSIMEKRKLDWLPVLKEQVKLLHHTLPDNITVTIHAEAPGPYMVEADVARLQQMILNLAVNARDAMPDGGELRLDLDKFDLEVEWNSLPAGSWLRLRVSDTGQGIAPENSRRIFEPFFTTKPPGKGSGLGLSQTQGIVLQHGGRIELSSVVGQGTIFTIYLPTVTGEVAFAAPSVAAQDGQQERVLLVEDNGSVRQALIASLEALNYEVTAVGHGREALDYLQANPGQVDAILSDMLMPVMGGAELFQQVQRLAHPVPMVIITGHQMDAELEELMAQGLRGWLMKPVGFDGLTHLLEQALR